MRAAGYARTGPAAQVLEVRDIPDPIAPAQGMVVVRVAASGINPHDTKARAGWTGGSSPDGFFVPHSDGAGVIVAVGSGVALTVGTPVWFFGAPHGAGSSAQLVSIEAWRVVPLPDALSFAEGACLGVPMLTAWLAVLSDGPVAGQTILVQGGGGAVGEIAVALAVAHGAQVVATARSPGAAARARARGSSVVVAPDDPLLGQMVADLTAGAGVPRIVEVDFSANQQTDVALLADHGVVASYSATSNKTPLLDYYAFARKAARIMFVQGMKLTPAQLAAALPVLTPLLEAVTLRPRIAASFPLDSIAAAHETVEKGAGGNVVLDLDGAVS